MLNHAVGVRLQTKRRSPAGRVTGAGISHRSNPLLKRMQLALRYAL